MNKAADLLYSLEDIRNELYALLNENAKAKNEHLYAWSDHLDGHHEPCATCIEYDARRKGVKRAIRHFGGRPNNWEPTHSGMGRRERREQ